MATDQLYQRDAFLKEFTATVTAVEDNLVSLDKTAFYPGGGGQPCDVGKLSFSGQAANVTKVGTMTVSFAEANAATLRYTMNGVEVTKNIQRQVFGTRASNCMPSSESRATSSNYQDLWWNAAESGWGLNIAHQDNTLFATLFTYDATGRDLWLVMSAGTRQADGSYLGDLFRTTGPPFNAIPFTPIGAGNVTTVGTMRLRFSDGNNGTLTYTYAGATVTKAITRQVFSSPVPLCN